MTASPYWNRRRIVMFRLLIFLVFIQLTISACPNGWLENGNSCYLFSNDEEYWTGAFEMCRIVGGHLVEINDDTENKFIAAQASSTGRQYWLSLTDVVEEGNWVWMTSKMPMTYSNWNMGEPTASFHGDFEDCVDMYTNGKWNDVTCTTRKFYVCEKENESIDIIG
ncbi:perlucin-like protein [Mercenaria mercenaria]|uniref:perlucin-like protein n=1 Tax=Mercenaria mercenaria TaxID=6596 RepID=UPI00234F8A43|nr:perlucin-like protein [Mercenaria mercenaria]